MRKNKRNHKAWMIIDRVVPGLYYAADSAGKMSVAEQRTPYEPPRRRRRAMRLSRRSRRAQGFYKVWVSDAPIEAE